jgi:nucleoid DNA-binding protein
MENDISKEEIIAAMLNEYDMDKEMAKQALDEFITVLSDADILET